MAREYQVGIGPLVGLVERMEETGRGQWTEMYDIIWKTALVERLEALVEAMEALRDAPGGGGGRE